MDNTLVPQVLLDHGQFVRALAHGLLRDAHAAEDVSQEVWLRYFEHRPGERGVRGWMRTVARNLVVNRGRGEKARALRERVVARAEALPSASEAVEHGELLRSVVEAVLALEEPYRETILARYFRGWDAERIAAATGTTAATVRSREHRALEKLRERLDREQGGERAAWAAVFARIVGPPTAAPAAAGGLAIAATIVAGVAAGALGVTWLRSLRGETAEPAPVVAASAPLPDAQPNVAARGPSPAAPAAAVGARVPVAPARRERVTSGSGTEFLGRLVFPGGAPAASVPLTFHGFNENGEELHHLAETDAEGRFAARFDVPNGFQLTLRAKAPGHAAASWRWVEVGSQPYDLGEIELPVGGVIVGRLVDADGQPLVGDTWQVHADSVGLWRGDVRNETKVVGTVDPATAAFRLEDVWPGAVELKANSPMAGWIRMPRTAVRSGETLAADIVYRGPRNATRITVTVFVDPFYVIEEPAPEHVQLVGASDASDASGGSGAVRTARWVEGASQSYSFDDLAEGTYSLQIDDPRFVPWSRSDVTPGQSIAAHLEGRSALRLAVRDGAGQPVERYAVRVAFRNVAFMPREFDVHDGSAPLPGGIVRGMFPGDYTVEVRGVGGAVASARVDDLVLDETRDVALTLGAEPFVAGRVLQGDGSVIAGASIVLIAPAAVGDSDASPVLPPGMAAGDESRYRRELARATTGMDGAFRVVTPGTGPFVVRAELGGVATNTAAFTLGPEGRREGVELVLARTGAVHGRIEIPAGSSSAGLSVLVVPEWMSVPVDRSRGAEAMLQRMQDWRTATERSRSRLAEDGTFTVAGLAPGATQVLLLLDDAVPPGFMGSPKGVPGALAIATFDVPEGGVVEQTFAPAAFPGAVVIDLAVNGAPAPAKALELRSDAALGSIVLRKSTDADGRCGPLRAFAGTWSIWSSDQAAGWSVAEPTLVTVAPGREARVTVDVEVASGTLVCVDSAGRPIANALVSVLHAGEELAPAVLRTTGTGEGTTVTVQVGGAGGGVRSTQILTRKTDAQGRLALELVPGEYLLQRGEYGSGEETGTPKALSWTSSGPTVASVLL